MNREQREIFEPPVGLDEAYRRLNDLNDLNEMVWFGLSAILTASQGVTA